MRLQRRLVGLLVRELVRAEVLHQQRIGPWVPDIRVDAVQDAGELVRLRLQHAMQAHAEGFGANLLGVRGAHGGDRIGELQTGLEHRHLAPELHAVHAAPLPRNPQRVGDGHGVVALESDVVDGDHASSALRRGQRAAPVGEVHGSEPARPVVRMHDIRLPARQRRRRQADARRHAREEGEAEGVVVVVLSMRRDVRAAGPVVQGRA